MSEPDLAGVGLHIVIGAGPAGLTAAWELTRLGHRVLVLEADPEYVGGIARTVEYKGNRFDMGGHRFYSKSDSINELWDEMLPDGFIEVQRLSRIYYDHKFFQYPIEIVDALSKLGFKRSKRIGFSYLRARLRPRRPETSFEDWVVNRFGAELYETFFRSYSEKVWGIPCSHMNKDFAAQRIRGLSLWAVFKAALAPKKRDTDIKTLITTFKYPRFGPGELWEAVREKIEARGGRVELDKRVVALHHEDGRMTAVETDDGSRYEADQFYPTMPLRDLIAALDPPAPSRIEQAANALTFRDFLTVALVVRTPDLFPDNWIYIHEPDVLVGRIQNYKNWSPAMVADPANSCLGMEYFCNPGDPIWAMDDALLITLAARELELIGLAAEEDCIDGKVVRVTDAYPVYASDYRRNRDTLKEWMNGYFKNVHPAGRGGLHNYNSQDHSMMASILQVRGTEEGRAYDVWAINTDEEYAEEGRAEANLETRLAPRLLDSPGDNVVVRAVGGTEARISP